MKRFKRVYIEIINICNLKCSFCPATTRNPGVMSIEKFCYILDQIKGHTEYLYLHIKGEPLLHPELSSILDICCDKGFKVNITTNGFLISSVKEILFEKSAIRQISFSIQSIETIKKEKDREVYLRDILMFAKEATRRTDIKIELRLWNLEQIYNEEDAIKNEKILDIIKEELMITEPLIEQFSKDKGKKLADNIFLSQSYVFEWPDINREIIDDSGFCYGLKQQIGILVDGTVVPCCLDSEGVINLGNVFEQSFLDILESNRTQQIIKGFSNRKVIEPLCQRCGYRNRFNGTKSYKDSSKG